MKTEKLAQWAEIISSLVVVITLLFLIHEVQRNTRALERQAEMDRNASVTTPFFEAPELASIAEKIKAVDGPDELPEALMDRYGLSYTEAELWSRVLYGMWFGMEADFDALGPEEVEGPMRTTLHSTDHQLYWETMGPYWEGTDFGAFVDAIAAEVKSGS
jgi:hypothetical protein